MRLSPSPAPAAGRSLRHAVVIDDEPGLRHVVRRWLEDSGYSVHVAADGIEGLHLVQEHIGIELVVTDIRMPGMSGYDVFEVLAEHRPEVSVLGMSAFPVSLEEERTLPILSKPFGPEQLLAQLEEAESRRRDAGARRRARASVQGSRTDLVQAAYALLEARRAAMAGPRRAPLCPSCGSDRPATIIYGQLSHEMREAFTSGRAVLGGVREKADAPQWQCRECGHRWMSAGEVRHVDQ